MSTPSPDNKNPDPASGREADGPATSRSYVLEVIGLVSAIGFFVGVLLAYRTYNAGLVTQAEFDRLQVGQTLAEVNETLGFDGTIVESSDRGEQGADGPADSDVSEYIWENSRLSFVRCRFRDGRLAQMESKELP